MDNNQDFHCGDKSFMMLLDYKNIFKKYPPYRNSYQG